MVLYKESKTKIYIEFVTTIVMIYMIFTKNGLQAVFFISPIFILFLLHSLNQSNEIIIENEYMIFNYNYLIVFKQKKVDIHNISNIKLHLGTIRWNFDAITFILNNKLTRISIDSKRIAYEALKDYFDKNGIEYEEF